MVTTLVCSQVVLIAMVTGDRSSGPARSPGRRSWQSPLRTLVEDTRDTRVRLFAARCGHGGRSRLIVGWALDRRAIVAIGVPWCLRSRSARTTPGEDADTFGPARRGARSGVLLRPATRQSHVQTTAFVRQP